MMTVIALALVMFFERPIGAGAAMSDGVAVARSATDQEQPAPHGGMASTLETGEFRRVIVGISAGGVVLGAILSIGDHAVWAQWAWSAATLPVLAALALEIASNLRRGVGLDIIAALAMTAALAFGEPLAGNVVALMYSGGQLLESFAQGRPGAK